jgi:NAD(P)-dependent dehydrogenase (short-subunit alcohol dehydrogenase family)
MVERLAGRRVVVTGSGGISAATVRWCVREGAAVHVVTRDEATAGELAEALPEVTWSLADLSLDSDSHAAFEQAETVLGGIDGLVAVAGGSARRMGDGPIDQLSTEGLNATVALNLATTTNALREFTARWLAREAGRAAAEPAARSRWASAVLIGSSLGRFPASPLFATHGYAATKAAIEGLARSAAAHYSRNRLTVNVVAPGLTKTPMASRAQEDEAVSAYARSRQPLTDDGFLAADDIADACGWMLGARTVTGQVIYVDGGWSVYGG